MKVKPWHIGCLVILILAALYFLVGTREGLDNPSCPKNGEGISSLVQSGGQNIRLYTEGECSAFGGRFMSNGARNWGMANDTVGECLGTSNGINIGFCNQGSPPSAAAANSLGMNMPTPTPPVVDQPPVVTPPPVTGAAPAASTVPTPAAPDTTSTVGGPSYNLTCTASPVSGMTGSVASPNKEPVWGINQSPSGWNSKNGFTMAA
jgi:hypothetical protein